MFDSRSLLDELVQRGFAKVPLDLSQAAILGGLHAQSANFFEREAADKMQFVVPGYTYGYRPPGNSHGSDPDVLDPNEAFLDWEHRLVPNFGLAQNLLSSIDTYRRAIAVPIIAKLVAELSAHYGRDAFEFRQRSVMQLNYFGELSAETSDQLLQSRHDDWTMATVLWTSAPGLWMTNGDRQRPITTDADEVLLLAGGVLAAMTNGALPPCYHEVRAGGGKDRMSMAYFANPDRGVPLAAGVQAEAVEEIIIKGAAALGLAESFYRRDI